MASGTSPGADSSCVVPPSTPDTSTTSTPTTSSMSSTPGLMPVAGRPAKLSLLTDPETTSSIVTREVYVGGVGGASSSSSGNLQPASSSSSASSSVSATAPKSALAGNGPLPSLIIPTLLPPSHAPDVAVPYMAEKLKPDTPRSASPTDNRVALLLSYLRFQSTVDDPGLPMDRDELLKQIDELAAQMSADDIKAPSFSGPRLLTPRGTHVAPQSPFKSVHTKHRGRTSSGVFTFDQAQVASSSSIVNGSAGAFSKPPLAAAMASSSSSSSSSFASSSAPDRSSSRNSHSNSSEHSLSPRSTLWVVSSAAEKAKPLPMPAKCRRSPRNLKKHSYSRVLNGVAQSDSSEVKSGSRSQTPESSNAASPPLSGDTGALIAAAFDAQHPPAGVVYYSPSRKRKRVVVLSPPQAVGLSLAEPQSKAHFSSKRYNPPL